MKPQASVEWTKRALDLVIGFAGTAAFLLAYPVLALLIKLESPGPALYVQQRVGRDRRNAGERRGTQAWRTEGERRGEDRRASNKGGRLFPIYKFRTMRLDAEANGPQLCVKGRDPRVTRIGHWLRALHLDELPQFWNVLKGDMSFIGPRPERPHFTVQYAEKIPFFLERTRVKPGLTGLAQITLGYDDSLDSVVRKTHFDLAYRASMTSLFSWLKVETWVLLNTVKYLFHRGPLGGAAALSISSLQPSLAAVAAAPRSAKGLSVALVRYRDTLKPTLVMARGGRDLDRQCPELAFPNQGKLDVCIRPGAQLGLEDLDLMARLAQQARRSGGQATVKTSHASVRKLLQETHLDAVLKVERPSSVANFITIDVECWFHAHNLGIPKSEWSRQPTRIVEDVSRILGLLKAHDAKATFFVLGWVADRYPEVVRMIDAGGHEIGTHGYMHDKVTDMTPYQFESDLDRSLNALGRHTSRKIIGHRASNFSVVESTYWALEILARNGIEYDSSIFPVRRDRYGVPDYPNAMPHVIELANGASIREVPLSTANVAGKALPISGGGYLRLYPYAVTDLFIRHRNLNGQPAMVYFHPWELDAKQERRKVGALKSFQHYVNLDTTEWKVHRMLERHRFTSVEENLKSRRMQAFLARNPVQLRGYASAPVMEPEPFRDFLEVGTREMMAV